MSSFGLHYVPGLKPAAFGSHTEITQGCSNYGNSGKECGDGGELEIENLQLPLNAYIHSNALINAL